MEEERGNRDEEGIGREEMERRERDGEKGEREEE